MSIEKAVRLLKKYHREAEETKKHWPWFIKNTVAWALYMVWMEARKEGSE